MAGVEPTTPDCLAGAESITPRKLFVECRHPSSLSLCTYPKLTCDTLRSSSCTLSNQGLCTRGGTRTRNLLLRGGAPYPLGHTSFKSGCQRPGSAHSVPRPSGCLRSHAAVSAAQCGGDGVATTPVGMRSVVFGMRKSTCGTILEAGLEPAISSLGGKRLIH